jgi:putative transposase
MPDHVHLVLTPESTEGLARAVGEAHRRYAAFVNKRLRLTGHLFQNRFASVALDEDHLMAAVRYVSLNPVRAKLAARARDWPWSSVRAHLAGRDDGLVAVRPVLDRAPHFADLLAPEQEDGRTADLRKAEGIGRPLGSADFIAMLERRLGRTLAPRKRGRKPAKESRNNSQPVA